MTSGKAIVRALRGFFVIAAALSTELVTSLLPTGEVSTLTDIHESVSNEGNTQVETLSENFNEAMDTDQRQTLLGINQGKHLERLNSDVMNQKVSPNDLAESQELVKLDNTLACLNNTLSRLENGKVLAAFHGLHWGHQGLHMLRETGM